MTLLTARVLAIRDVLLQLLAREASRVPEPELLFQEIAEATETRIYQTADRRPPTKEAMAIQEEVQKQVDWIVGTARLIARKNAAP